MIGLALALGFGFGLGLVAMPFLLEVGSGSRSGWVWGSFRLRFGRVTFTLGLGTG